jgi:glycosyltransferase involved in cell wall biosynthesis
MTPSAPRVLLISQDPVGEQMAGMGIRYTELARALAAHAEVTLAAAGDALDAPSFAGVRRLAFRPHAPDALAPHVAAADVVVCPPQWPVVSRWLRRSRARVVHDLYDPEALETLELFAGRRPIVRRTMVALTLDRLDDALRTGHHFVCASEKQRDLWLGALLAGRLVDPARYDADPALRDLLDVVPFGLPAEPPRHDPAQPSFRDRFPALGEDDEIVLWNGGLWRWLDAPTAIRAVAALRARRPGLRLVFMGAGTGAAGRDAGEEARGVAAQLGLLGTVVHFNDGWVPYAHRANWLLDAACAISTHRDHLETRFAFRTRLLDCFWAGLPVVCTEGDDLAQRVEREGLGATCAAGSAESVAAALERVLERGRAAHADALAAAAAELTWPRVVAPLVRWLQDPAAPPPRLVRSAPLHRTPAHHARVAAYAVGRRALDRAQRRRR